LQQFYDSIMRKETTYYHASLVAELSGLIAKETGESEENTAMIVEAARLHDIGKNYLPQELLNKPGKLTTEEYDKVKHHAEYGFDHIVRHIKCMMLAAIIALQHHEFMDGSGYAGSQQIHTYAKMVAVADVFDALVSERPYKSPWPPSEVIEHMEKARGTQFHPLYLDTMMGMMDEILVLYEKSGVQAS